MYIHTVYIQTNIMTHFWTLLLSFMFSLIVVFHVLINSYNKHKLMDLYVFQRLGTIEVRTFWIAEANRRNSCKSCETIERVNNSS